MLSMTLTSGMPFSKRVNEAAEHFLGLLFSTMGSFPQASGPETLSCRLTEELVAQLSTLPLCKFQHYLAFASPVATNPPSPDLLLSIAETLDRPGLSTSGPEDKRWGQPIARIISEPTPVFTFLRDASGRHLWSWKLRYEPKAVEATSHNPKSNLRLKESRHLKSCLDNNWPTRLAEGALDPFMPWARDTIPLVRA